MSAIVFAAAFVTQGMSIAPAVIPFFTSVTADTATDWVALRRLLQSRLSN